MKILVFLPLFLFSLSAKTFHFKEFRYSEAIDKTISFQGDITFFKNSLTIKYNNKNRTLEYLGNKLTYTKDGEKIYIDDVQKNRIIQFFKILLIIYHNDRILLNEQFEIINSNYTEILKPIGVVKNYIEKIELKKKREKFDSIKLFLKNGDSIKIVIEDEIY